ncbi:DUF4097 family beta strand repeat-containing protein [Paenibacillus macerans]|uniref:DUF4097 family beta strand repeat protein n=1 Tax=Paenibacillus macerans TaxID=44252 RepID=A0A090Y963_PAEMA|nr:DUF4097 family beta strand repeat-containing protein [Paenibacillus macerans]KFM94721.1 hypothetical protein DJ90_5968 [Paenibacillus macerans]MCY7558644.1 DUF4097 domain-containing protein [Paenibacillus macerans]MEC0139257.1 DUF4097 family beta strand repeat-containing protein [Paenibacillus macerans]MEC0152757.1 DUF4097 family beta strand repeat-containing protein [Paenibacillus macerans]MEC0332272.1 DUF4097 family beta strand repeat-containing protein [Paenibacillus macerans]
MNSKRWTLLGLFLIVLGLAGMAYQRFDFGEKLPAYQQKWTFGEGELENLHIEGEYDVDVEFIDSPDGAGYIEASGNMKQEAIDKIKAAAISGQTLKLEFEEPWDWSFFSMNFQSTKQHITVALAKDSGLKAISYKSVDGNGSFAGLKAENIELSVSSGNIRADAVQAETLKFTATTGNITAERVEVQGNAEIKLGSGNIKINELQGALTAKATSGNITASGVEGPVEASLGSGNIKFTDFTGNGKLKSTSGNITLENQRSDSLDIAVQSGSVKLSIDPQFRGVYDLRTKSGSITAPESPQQSEDVVKVRTTSGDIRIR